MNILKFDLILFIVIGIPMALIFGKIVYMQKQKFKDEIEDELRLKQNSAKAKNNSLIQPEPGSEEHFQRWKAEREKREP